MDQSFQHSPVDGSRIVRLLEVVISIRLSNESIKLDDSWSLESWDSLVTHWQMNNITEIVHTDRIGSISSHLGIGLFHNQDRSLIEDIFYITLFVLVVKLR